MSYTIRGFEKENVKDSMGIFSSPSRTLFGRSGAPRRRKFRYADSLQDPPEKDLNLALPFTLADQDSDVSNYPMEARRRGIASTDRERVLQTLKLARLKVFSSPIISYLFTLPCSGK